MAPPVSNCVRVQSIFQGISLLPEDRFVNTFHFLTAASPVTTAHMDEAMNLVEQFYEVDHDPGAGLPLLSYITGIAINPNACELRAYNMEQPEPREPRVREGWINVGMSQQASLPSEVAVCTSFFSQRNLPGRRGRLYIGPLSQEVNSVQGGNSRPSAEFVNVLAAASEFLAGAGVSVSWAVLAKGDPATPALSPLEVTGGWVDNAWDTQRRRGLDASNRVVWP